MARSSANRASGFGSTLRQDAWWVEILPVVAVLGLFTVYATFRAFEGRFYEWGPYLSPFYSPLIDPEHHWWRLSPALLVLIGPLGFRATCYYYRKAYYRAFFLDPPGCAVGEGRKGAYRGETSFPFILQNLHRWFLYLAIVYLFFLWRDAIRGFFFQNGFGVGVGSLVLLANISLLTLYTFSCHSLRHLAGGKLDCFSCTAFGGPRHTTWRWLSWLNERHMLFAWMSLFSVGLADLYVRVVSAGVLRDFRLL
ncbi:succinate dehydrogenase [Edaphobacter bradus]|uniref:succinate dehydrogenase n=1 Tax=Edaphobacter bradus TaxID=2259016 RepID=UPI0021E00180|nr:succinate dehydrogenase [Edaphobacter bradus]